MYNLNILLPIDISSLFTWPQGYEKISFATQLGMKFQLLIKTKKLKYKDFSWFKALTFCIYHANKC